IRHVVMANLLAPGFGSSGHGQFRAAPGSAEGLGEARASVPQVPVGPDPLLAALSSGRMPRLDPVRHAAHAHVRGLDRGPVGDQDGAVGLNSRAPEARPAAPDPPPFQINVPLRLESSAEAIAALGLDGADPFAALRSLSAWLRIPGSELSAQQASLAAVLGAE